MRDTSEPLFPSPRLVDTGEIRMAVHELGGGPPVILVHGFPELAFSWRHQLPALRDAGYRAIAPDMRGYGGTDKPADMTDYTLRKLIGDIQGLMAALDVERAVMIGHDWGAIVVWHMALLEPERLAGLINLNIPHIPRPPIDPILYMRWKLGKDFYIVNFQKSDEADRRCNEDPRRFIDLMMRRRLRSDARNTGRKSKRRPFSILRALDGDAPGGEALLTADELRHYADAFAAGGFTGPINWYRNWSHNWKSMKGIDQTVRVPSLFVQASDDFVVSQKQIDAMLPHVPDLEVAVIENCGHWTQQEQPERLNAIILDWLARRYPV